jgi:putative SOS response-associated peptidase YedK
MAGLFEAWRASETEDWRLTCCVITTTPNALMAPIHDRMPVLIAREDWAAGWPAMRRIRPRLAPLLVPCDPAGMQAWPVSRAVNRGRAEGEALIEAVPQVG